MTHDFHKLSRNYRDFSRKYHVPVDFYSISRTSPIRETQNTEALCFNEKTE